MHRILGRMFIVPLMFTVVSAAEPAASVRPNQGGRAAAEVYVVPFSHLDYFWAGTREECLARGNQIIAKAIELARKQPEFRFLIEDNDFLANYVETHGGTRELSELKQLVKVGRVEIAPKWAAIYQNLPDGEAQIRNIAIGKRYAREHFGVDPQVAHLGDLPGYTLQFPQILAQTGIPYMVMTRMGPSDHPLFRWRGPDGSRALVWSGGHYGSATRFFGSETAAGEARRSALLKFVNDKREHASLPVYMTWGSDLYAPTSKIVEDVLALNKEDIGVHVTVATPSDFFRHTKDAGEIAELSGEIPSSWPNLLSSLPHMWPKIVPAANALLNAEKFAALNYAMGLADYPRERLERLWRKLLEAMDHNQDGQGGFFADERKLAYMDLAEMEGGEILRDSLRNIAEQVQVPAGKNHPIVVFNASSWPRADVVKAHMSLYGEVNPGAIADYKKAMKLVDEKGVEVPFHVEQYMENMSRSLAIVFVARDVPPLGYRAYYMVPSTPQPLDAVSVIHRDADKDVKEPRRPRGSDVVETEYYRLTIDTATGSVALFDKALGRDVVKGMEIVAQEERGGNYIGVEPLTGRIIPNANITTMVEENNAVRTVVRIKGTISDIPVVQRLIFYRGLKRLDVENTIEWKEPRLVRIEQLFPLLNKDARIQYGVPFGSNAGANIIPNTEPHASDEITKQAWMQSRDVHNWIWAGDEAAGLTIATDHYQLKLADGVIRAQMARGTRFTSARVVTGERIGSLNYPPPGTYTFRYSLSSSAGDWAASRSWRAGIDFNNSLLPVSVVDTVSPKTLPASNTLCQVSGDNIVVSALKKADSSDALVLRVYEMQGKAGESEVKLLGKTHDVTDVNLLEEASAGASARRVMAVQPYQIRTVKLGAAR